MSSYAPQARDTAAAVDRLVFDGLRAMTPTERLALAARASAALERLSMAGLGQRCPGLTEDELRRRAGALRLGRDLTLRAFGAAAGAWLP